MNSIKKLNPVVTELVIRSRKLNVSTDFFFHKILFSSIKRCKTNLFIFFIMKIPNKREPQQITFNHSSSIGFKDFLNLYKKCVAKPCF